MREVVLSGLQARKKLFGRYTSADREKAENLLRICGIESVARRPIGALSGGQLQRARLGRALISDPKLLILDEPTNFVDNRFEKELYALLKQFNDKMAIVMVSHDLGTISSHVKQIVCVNRHVHRHDSNRASAAEQLHNYDCPIQVVFHGDVPHTGARKALVEDAEKLRELLRTFFYSSRTDVRSTFRLFANAAKLLEHRIHA